ncbi:hypothetical protein [Thiohalobacter thiocyanaticus]|uniref:hypothetical protein n=1 Tax=Thiohalobacter thiocyanaticus TaxID=585455 RepID=UPI000F62ECBC|nr:hypothetical protein [Thiohalobacter thiocyanaticus]
MKEVMNPLVQQIKDHKRVMEKRLETLRRINESRDTLEARIKELEAEQATLGTICSPANGFARGASDRRRPRRGRADSTRQRPDCGSGCLNATRQHRPASRSSDHGLIAAFFPAHSYALHRTRSFKRRPSIAPDAFTSPPLPCSPRPVVTTPAAREPKEHPGFGDYVAAHYKPLPTA